MIRRLRKLKEFWKYFFDLSQILPIYDGLFRFICPFRNIIQETILCFNIDACDYIWYTQFTIIQVSPTDDSPRVIPYSIKEEFTMKKIRY